MRGPDRTGCLVVRGRADGVGSDVVGSASAAPVRLAGELSHAVTGRREVALTFHGAGDEALARRVLTLLHDRGAAATVLAVGTWLQQYPDAGRMVVGLGHELGNHTWSHPDLAALDENGLRVEIERCRTGSPRPQAAPAHSSGPPRPSTPPRSFGAPLPQQVTRECCRTTSTRGTSPTPARR